MKRLMMVAALMAMSVVVFAQTVQFGLKGGLNVASLDVDNEADFTSRAAFHIGGLAHIHVSPHFAVQPELFYSGQGGKRPAQEVQLGYLNMPVLLQYMAGNGLRLQTGPQLGVLLSAEQEVQTGEQGLEANFKTVDVSWSFGAGYLFPRSNFGIDARYNLGLNNVNEGTTEVQNRVFSIGVFYQFAKAR